MPKKLTTQQFIKRAILIHKNKYDYSKVKYKGWDFKVIIICPDHGEFLQRPNCHSSGKGCSKCANNIKLTSKEFIRRANQTHNNKYNYTKVSYKNAHSKVIIICPVHKEFKQIAREHVGGQGCPKCSTRISKSSQKWLTEIEKQNNIKLEREKFLLICNKKFFIDGFDKQSNTCYEYYGNYWHGNPDIYNPNDFNIIAKKTFRELYQKTLEKEKLLKSAGYKLITKWGN